MNVLRSLTLLLLFAGSIALGAARNADAQSTTTDDLREMQYLGSTLTLARLENNAVADFGERVKEMDGPTGWVAPDWQFQVVADAGVLNALYAEWLALEVPPRYAPAHAIFLRSAAANDRAGTHMRQGIAADDPATFGLALNDLTEGSRFGVAGSDLLKQLSRSR